MIRKLITQARDTELTEAILYKKLAHSLADGKNKKILLEIAEQEESHAKFWNGLLQDQGGAPSHMRIFFYYAMSKIFGLNFGVRLMEKTEHHAQKNYEKIVELLPEHRKQIQIIIEEEKKHEQSMLDMLKEERLSYLGSMVLGLNDALIELTGALAGFTLALRDPQTIAIVGVITGIAASLSMAASEFLSTQVENSGKSPVKAATYTGISYIITVMILIAPFIGSKNPYRSLSISLIATLSIIAFFTFYTSIAQNIPFTKRFLQMAGLSLGVSAISFAIGFFIRLFTT